MMALALSVHIGFAQRIEDRVDIYFRQDVHDVEEDLRDNSKSLERLSTVFDRIVSDSLSDINKIEINSWTSPEPSVGYNKKLSERRSNSIRDYILERWDLPDTLLVANGNGIAWDKLRKLVAESNMKYRDEVLYIIDNQPEETWRRVNPNDRWLTLVDSREKHLMDLRSGIAYKYLYENIYPQLRYGSQVSFFYKEYVPIVLDNRVERDLPELNDQMPHHPIDTWERVPLFAIKTNLLFDAITILNIEVEVLIKDKFSIAAEWDFPWWVTKNNGNALEILSGSLEGRYWFGDREDKPKLTGWFGGVYASGSLYDVQWKSNGYQGESYIGAGLTAGYAHTINRRETLRMEYSLGLGVFKTDYRYYEGRESNEYLVWQHDGEFLWAGPTKAKISLVWMLHRTKRVKQ